MYGETWKKVGKARWKRVMKNNNLIGKKSLKNFVCETQNKFKEEKIRESCIVKCKRNLETKRWKTVVGWNIKENWWRKAYKKVLLWNTKESWRRREKRKLHDEI